ncbi:hypothetical protein [Paraferrimonas haliotis]|uniref:DUF4397 domain-containing protein n=1 Tax=Paraferrimonas haliotis TaxID=2013866 RepID=A0AA37TTU3_9GAMM|nr:hypothetical protein [Paraferrimonas haliotis]GLS84342.1 hypothetical protein GCM10007894_23190 [Paraferrimonas haliotis]
MMNTKTMKIAAVVASVLALSACNSDDAKEALDHAKDQVQGIVDGDTVYFQTVNMVMNGDTGAQVSLYDAAVGANMKPLFDGEKNQSSIYQNSHINIHAGGDKHTVSLALEDVGTNKTIETKDISVRKDDYKLIIAYGQNENDKAGLVIQDAPEAVASSDNMRVFVADYSDTELKTPSKVSFNGTSVDLKDGLISAPFTVAKAEANQRLEVTAASGAALGTCEFSPTDFKVDNVLLVLSADQQTCYSMPLQVAPQ